MKFLEALPNYFGGKRKLLTQIFKHVDGETFIDAFMGGGSVALTAKAKGFRVIANDYALRSFLIGKAFIENDSTVLDEFDVLACIAPFPQSEPGFMQMNYSPDILPENYCTILDGATQYLKTFEDKTKKALLQVLLIKFIQKSRPFGQFNRKLPKELIEKKNFQALHEHKVFYHHYKDFFTPLTVLNRLRKKVNQGVFVNGKKNEIYKLDVFDFLKAVKGDTVYLDPPYFGSDSYENEYNLIDNYLDQKMQAPGKSFFNRKAALDFLELLFQACEKFPTWIVSYGEQEFVGEKLLTMIQNHRPCELIKLNHRYSVAAQSCDKIKHAKEILLIARRN